MRIGKRTIFAFFGGLLLGTIISITIIDTSVKKNAEIKTLKEKVEILQNINRSLNIDLTTTKK